MKIPLDFSNDLDRITVSCSMKFNNSIFSALFVIDTGSPKTFIDEITASHGRIFTKNLDFEESALMGGTKISMYDLGRVTLNFRVDGSKLFQRDFESMKVAGNARPGKKSINTPVSIIGLDFLKELKATLFVDPDRKIGYIEVPS